jgi:hypothetical protein
MVWVVAVPAYGRDYRSAAQVREAWAAGKDFLIQPSGQYINKEDADRYGVGVQLRYAKRTKVIIIMPGQPKAKPKTQPEVKSNNILSIGNVLQFKQRGEK